MWVLWPRCLLCKLSWKATGRDPNVSVSVYLYLSGYILMCVVICMDCKYVSHRSRRIKCRWLYYSPLHLLSTHATHTHTYIYDIHCILSKMVSITLHKAAWWASSWGTVASEGFKKRLEIVLRSLPLPDGIYITAAGFIWPK